MTNKETVERNIGLTFDFVNHLIENPYLVENLPEDFKLLEFIEKDFPIYIADTETKAGLL